MSKTTIERYFSKTIYNELEVTPLVELKNTVSAPPQPYYQISWTHYATENRVKITQGEGGTYTITREVYGSSGWENYGFGFRHSGGGTTHTMTELSQDQLYALLPQLHKQMKGQVYGV